MIVAAEGPSVPDPLHAGRRLAAEPEIVADWPALLQGDVVDAIANQMRRDESVLGDHRLRGRAGLAGAALVHGPNPELILVALDEAVAATLDLVAQLLDLLDGERLALDPLAHVLLLHLDDVVGDRSATVRCRRIPN